MRKEQLTMSLKQRQEITHMLQSQGLNQADIEQILDGKYEICDTENDIDSSLGGLKKHSDILQKLSDGYTIDELSEQGISTQSIQEFNDMLKTKNITIDNAQAIYQYSVESNMMLGIKRGTSKETIQSQIMIDLEQTLQRRGIEQGNIDEIKHFIKNADYESTLHENYEVANEYMEQMGLQKNARVSIRNAMQSMDRCVHIDGTINSLEEGLGNTGLQKNMKLYRAVKSDYLQRGLKEGEDLSSLVGKTISNKGQTSTSPLYDSSFAKYDDYDTVFEIYAPQGSRGSYISDLSAYDSTEQEVLLNPNDLYITNVQTGVIDKNGKTKNVLQALALSKDRECYREIENQKVEIPNQGQDFNQGQLKNITNLPARQNRFIKFFNQMKGKFARTKTLEQQNENSYSEKSKSNQTQQLKEKKSWELEPEEKAKIQKETAKIAQKYREQEELQKQASGQELQQGDAQTLNQGQTQQPIMDMGGMEL